MGNKSREREQSRLQATEFADRMMKSSPLKREKFLVLASFLPPVLDGLTLVDVGGDSGVISVKFRELGGEWISLDLITEAVESIRALVGERALQMEGERLPLGDGVADVVVIVDMLEHVEDDHLLVREIYRVLKPGGLAIFHVPNPREGWLRRFRFFLGQTDEKHGHVRPGYTEKMITSLLTPCFSIDQVYPYSGFFAQLLDMALNLGVTMLGAGKKSKKGSLVTQKTLEGSRLKRVLLSLVPPLLSAFIALDRIFPCTHRWMLVVQGRKEVQSNTNSTIP